MQTFERMKKNWWYVQRLAENDLIIFIEFAYDNVFWTGVYDKEADGNRLFEVYKQ